MSNFYNLHFKRKNYVLLLTVLLVSINITAQKPRATSPYEISLEGDEKIDTEVKGNKSINVHTGWPMAIYQVNFEVPQGTPENMALYYLQKEYKTLGIPQNELANLRHHATRSTNAGSVVRFRQYTGEYPVNKAEVTISISPQNMVVLVMNSYEINTNLSSIQPTINSVRAYEIARNYLNIRGPISYSDVQLMVYKNNKMKRLAHEVVISAEQPSGEWHVYVDAVTEEIFKAVDMAHYYDDKDKIKNGKDSQIEMSSRTMVPVNGTGFVFNPDPLSSNQVFYGGGYVDGNDANTTQLNNARVSVTLRDIDLTAGVYTLRGPRAEIVDFEAPFNGLFSQNNANFSFTRNDQAFEAVNAYYHIDYLMSYINETLGCNVLPYQYSGGVRFDPHGVNGADNSYYSTGTGRLSFGEGCVDDAEDSDVIHHELGHGLHDWVTSGGLSQVNGLSEGSGDYIAQSYNRSLGNWTSNQQQYNWVFNWDGHNACWGGRVTNSNAIYPSGLVGQIHADGQIWSSCLMGIWDQIGREEMDKIFYEGLGMTNGSSNQNDAANAVYQAAINLNYSQAQLVAIHDSLEDCGYTLPELPGPPIASFSSDTDTICLDNQNSINFIDTTSPSATSWLWTFEGGTPASSTDPNPTITYSTEGTYDVTLSATNEFGTDVTTITDYVTVLAGDNCPTCVSPTNTTTIPISTTGNVTYNSVINVAGGGAITDVNVTINITHTWDDDMDIYLISPTGTLVELTTDNGDDGDNFVNTVFDQQATNSITTGTAPFTGSFLPEGNLSDFNGEDAAGNWTLRITDDANQDGGQLNSWMLEVCVEPALSIAENEFEGFSLYPNPNSGEFIIKLNSYSNKNIKVEVYDVQGRSVFNTSYDNTSNFNQKIQLNTIASGMYLVKVSDGERKIIRKIIIE